MIYPSHGLLETIMEHPFASAAGLMIANSLSAITFTLLQGKSENAIGASLWGFFNYTTICLVIISLTAAFYLNSDLHDNGFLDGFFNNIFDHLPTGSEAGSDKAAANTLIVDAINSLTARVAFLLSFGVCLLISMFVRDAKLHAMSFSTHRDSFLGCLLFSPLITLSTLLPTSRNSL